MSLGALAYGPIERLLRSPKRTTLAAASITGAAFLLLGLSGPGHPGRAVALLSLIGAAGMTYGILMAHARLFFPAHLLGRGVTFMNFVFIGGAGVVQWLSGRFVQAGREAGTPPDVVFGHLYLAFGVALLAAAAIYAFAPARPAQACRPFAGATPLRCGPNETPGEVAHSPGARALMRGHGGRGRRRRRGPR